MKHAGRCGEGAGAWAAVSQEKFPFASNPYAAGPRARRRRSDRVNSPRSERSIAHTRMDRLFGGLLTLRRLCQNLAWFRMDTKYRAANGARLRLDDNLPRRSGASDDIMAQSVAQSGVLCMLRPLPRRAVLAAPLVITGVPLTARAQAAWPERPVTLIVPWAPGGSNDVVARMVAPGLESRFGQPFVVENRPGGGGSLGMGMVVRARPDGLTLLISSASNHVFHPLISPDLGYQVPDALAGVAMMVDVPNVVAATNGLGVNSIPELVEKIRATRGGVAFASSGVGSSNHLAGELFKLRANLDMTHVPYRGGGQAMPDLIGGTVPVGFLNLPTVSGPAAAGRVKLLAVGSDTRVASRPEIPTVQEGGVPNYAVRSWTGLFAPKATPAPIVERISAAMKEILEQPAIRGRLVDGGSEPIWSSPADTDRFVVSEYARWQPVVKAANVKPE